MKAPVSRRSRRLGRAWWALFWLNLIGQTVSLIVGLPHVTIDQHGPVFWIIGVPILSIWLILPIAYLISRLNDAWDEDFRQRRAAARSARS